MKKQFENNQFILYSPDSLKYVTDNLEEILNERLLFYKKIFNINEFRRVRINYFDNQEKFRKFIYDLRGESSSLPKYATGTFDQGMINAFIKPDIVLNSDLYNKILYLAPHELFHIMYKELVWEKNYNRITWFDEGMAQLFSGEYSEKTVDDEFQTFFYKVVKETKIIPNLNKISHSNNFVCKDYNGYALSFLAVKYLFDTMGLDEFRLLMKDERRIKEVGKSVINEMIKFYKDKYNKIIL